MNRELLVEPLLSLQDQLAVFDPDVLDELGEFHAFAGLGGGEALVQRRLDERQGDG
jgi:hypothetical protein